MPKTTYGESAGGPRQVGVVTIETDEGIQGHSFLGSSLQSGDELAGQVLQRLKPAVMGRNPLDIGAIWQDLWARHRRVASPAICAVDVALWDIAGKVAGLPIHRLIGTYRDKVPAYASSASMSDPQQYVDEALSFRDRGWTAYKIHPVKNPKKDVEICAAVKNAIGDSMVLMLDSMWVYGYEDALRVGLAIQEMGYYWYEDPLA